MSPFDYAVHSQSPKSIEVMLEMMIYLEDYSMSQFIKKHITTLLAMELKVFEKYLDYCFFKHKNMKETKTIPWDYDEDEVYIDFHTSYLG